MLCMADRLISIEKNHNKFSIDNQMAFEEVSFKYAWTTLQTVLGVIELREKNEYRNNFASEIQK